MADSDTTAEIFVKNTFLDVPLNLESVSSLKRSLSESELYKKQQVAFKQNPAVTKVKSDSSTSSDMPSTSISRPDPSALSDGSQSEEAIQYFRTTENNKSSTRSQIGVQMPGVVQQVIPPPMPHPLTRPWKKTLPAPRLLISVGTMGHPMSCAEACKYVKRKTGCRDGAQCSKCHRCHWSRPAGGVQWLQEAKGEISEEPDVISIGTLGHPYNCGEACKYFKRKGGCMHGTECKSCHKCHWQRRRLEQNPTAVLHDGADSTKSLTQYQDSSEWFKRCQLMQERGAAM